MTSPHTPQMIRHLKTVAEPSLSPDGSKLAYTLGWVDPDLMESQSRIMVTDLVSGEEREFTRGPKDTSARFSPDVGLLAFCARPLAGLIVRETPRHLPVVYGPLSYGPHPWL